MKRISWTLGILLTLSLLIAAGCSGEDPIKAKRIAIENGTYKPNPDKPDPNKPDTIPTPDPEPDPEPNPLGKMETKEITFTFDDWAQPNDKATFMLPVEKALPKLLAGDPYWACLLYTSPIELNGLVTTSVQYLSRRISRQVEILFEPAPEELYCLITPDLMSWVIEIMRCVARVIPRPVSVISR